MRVLLSMALCSLVYYYSSFFLSILIDWADETTSSKEVRPNNWEGFQFDYCLLIVMEILISLIFFLYFFKTFLLYKLCISNSFYLYIYTSFFFLQCSKKLKDSKWKESTNFLLVVIIK